MTLLAGATRRRLVRWLVTFALISPYVGSAEAYSVVVPPTPYGTGVDISVAATTLLDVDSVFMCYREGESIKFQVININTGVSELTPQVLPGIGVSATCTVVSSETAVVAVRDASNLGVFFTVNALTGAIQHGPVVFGPSRTGLEYRLTASDRSTVFIVWRSDEGLPGFKHFEGRFAIIDPVAGIVRVPETTFEPEGINTVDVVALNPHRVALAYQRSITGPVIQPTRAFIAVLDAHSGAMLRDPIEIESNFGIPRILRLTESEVLVTYRTSEHSRFVTANVLTGTVGAPVTYTSGLTWDFSVSPALLGQDAVFIPYWRPETVSVPSHFVVEDLFGIPLVPETPFTPPSTHVISATASGCRALVTYPEGFAAIGVFQILDFSDVCTRAPCPTDITDHVDIVQLPDFPFLLPFLRLQPVLIHNRTAEPIQGPMAFGVRDLQQAILFTTTSTACVPPNLMPFVPVVPGHDNVLTPGETVGGFLLFLKTAPGAIIYTPRLFDGLPSR